MISISVDTKEFDKVFREYMKYSKRSLVEACNAHAYYIARSAVADTKGADKDRIYHDLMAESRTAAGAPIAAILINKQRGKAHQKGLEGPAMEAAVEKFIKLRQLHRNFLRSGWIPAIKILQNLVPRKKAMKPIPSGTAKASRTFGGARKATDNSWSPFALIWNAVQGGLQNNPRARRFIEQGANQAIKEETQSMLVYINRKLDEAAGLWK